MRRDLPPRQRFAELGPQEATRRVARDAVIPAIDRLAHAFGPSILNVPVDDKSFVIDDGLNSPVQRCEQGLDLVADRPQGVE